MGGMGAELRLALHYQLFTLTCTEVRSSTEWGRAGHDVGQTQDDFPLCWVGLRGEAM